MIGTVDSRQHDVEDDQVGGSLPGHGERARPFGSGLDHEPFAAQGVRDRLAKRRLVIDDEDRCLGSSSLIHYTGLNHSAASRTETVTVC